jgi:hypothetical protein
VAGPQKSLHRKKQVRLSIPLSSYPFRQDRVTKAESVELIRVMVYPAVYRKDAVKLIRSRIDYGIKKGLVPRSSSFPAESFFSWALLQKGWEALGELPGLPRLPNPVSIAGEIGLSVDFFSVTIPSDVDALREAYRKVSLERHQLAMCNRELEIQNGLYLDELEQLRSKYKQRVESARTNAAKPRHRRH